MQGCKGVFEGVLEKLERAAERGDAVHEVEETTWFGLIEMGREMIAGYIKKQEEEIPRPKVIEHEGKKLHRLPGRRMRPYVSAFGPTPFRRYVVSVAENNVGLMRPPAKQCGRHQYKEESTCRNKVLMAVSRPNRRRSTQSAPR